MCKSVSTNISPTQLRRFSLRKVLLCNTRKIGKCVRCEFDFMMRSLVDLIGKLKGPQNYIVFQK